MCFKFILAGGLVCTLLSSCSVLEDRTACPCTLYLDMTDPRNGICDTLLVRVCCPDGFSCDLPVSKNLYPDVQTITVPSRHGASIFVIDAAVAADYLSASDGGLSIPLGKQCPPAYMYSSYCDTAGESCVDTVIVSKNYCGVTLNFISEDLELYDICVIGNVSGYSSSGMPVRGKFQYSPSGTKECYFRLPRQIDESLKLTLAVPGGREKTFALGQYIAQSGYDWTKADLEDLAVTIDYAATNIVVTIDDWSTTIEYDVVV